MPNIHELKSKMLTDVISGRKVNANRSKSVDLKKWIEDEKREPAFRTAYDDAREKTQIARQLHGLRERRGLTQRQVAEKLGTSQQVISRLENPAYTGHSLTMLRRVVQALGGELHVRIVG